jgi:hypothetical protein
MIETTTGYRLASAALQGRPLNRNREEVSVPTEEKMADKKTDQDNSKHPRTEVWAVAPSEDRANRGKPVSVKVSRPHP